ncbi:MAG TPA: MFS transporter, partial [Ktedonobacteraceae bacterium]
VRFPFFAGGRLSLPVQLGAIYSVVFFASICAQFFQPARLALTGDVVDEAQRAQGSGLGQVTQSLASILGPPLAAPLLFGFGVQWALLINALSFGLSFLVLAAVQAPPSARSVEPGHGGTLGQEFRQGLRFAFSHRVIRALIIASFITLLGAGAINALNVFFFTQNLHAPVTLVGLMDAVFGIGIIVGALLAGAFAQRIGLERTLSWAVLAAGIVFLILARMANLGAALGLIALLGVFQAGISVSIGPLVLKVTPRSLVGRVAAVLTPSSTLASLVAVVLAGYLASTVLDRLHTTVLGMTVGPIDTIFTGAGLLIVLAGLYLLKNLGQAAAFASQPETNPMVVEGPPLSK